MELLLGIVYSLLSFLSLASMSALVKAASATVDTAVIVFFQNFLSFIMILPATFYLGFNQLKTKHLPLHLLRAITGTGAWYALFLAITKIPLTNAVLLTYSAPLWIPIIAWLIQRVPTRPQTWLGIAMGFVGIAFVLQPSTRMFQWGGLYALAAGIILALALLSVSWLKQTEKTYTILFYYFLFSSVMFLPAAIYHWQTPNFLEAIYLLGISLALILSQIFIILAYRKASAVTLSPLIYSVIIFTALINWLVWHSVPNRLETIGIFLVITGGVLAMTL